MASDVINTIDDSPMVKHLCFFLALWIMTVSCAQTNPENKGLLKAPSDTIQLEENVINNSQTGIDSLKIGLTFFPKNTYIIDKSHVSSIKKQLMSRFSKALDKDEENHILDSSSYIFTEILLNHIVPHWYGTPWDFEGHTAIPNQGEIACGYFVSTTLRDMGLRLNRYKLAQQVPKNEAISIAIDSNEVTTLTSNDISNYLSKLKDGLYFVGLDNHVGYLLIRQGSPYFIHSNYIDNKVMIEPTKGSIAFQSDIYVLSKLSGNTLLIKKWLLGETISIYSN